MVSGDGSTLGDADDFVTAFTTAGFTNLTAEVISSGEYKGAIKITHELGGDFRMNDGATAADPTATGGTPLADAGLSTSQAHAYGTYTANSTTLIDNLYIAPAGDKDDSTLGKLLLKLTLFNNNLPRVGLEVCSDIRFEFSS